MAVHKVPLDVEADDKFLGPLSFKQFLFAGGFIVFGYLTFLMLTRGIWPLAIVFFFPTFVGGVFAFPWSKEQPSELFLASRIRFFLKPRRRIWDQSGLKDLVKITVPKREVHAMTDGLDQGQVRSRFSALATMVDSRGWAVKNLSHAAVPASDRLVEPTTTEAVLVDETQDVMDEDNSNIAKQFDSMIQKSTQHQKSAARELVEHAKQSALPEPEQKQQSQDQDFWFMHQQQQGSTQTILPSKQSKGSSNQSNMTATPTQPTMSEEELLERAKAAQRRSQLQTGQKHGTVVNPEDGSVRHEKPLEPPKSAFDDTSTSSTAAPSTASNQPSHAAQDTPVGGDATNAQIGQDAPGDGAQSSIPTTVNTQSPSQVYVDPGTSTTNPVTAQKDPAILELAQSNDLNVETLARQANKKGLDDGEVVISLH
jgi:hypothetical protein